MTTETAAAQKIDIADLVTRTVSAARKNLATKLGMATLLVGIPNALVSALQLGTEGETPDPATSGLLVLVALISIITGVFLETVIISMTLREIDGAEGSLGQHLLVGLKRFFPVLGFTLVVGLAVVLSALLFLAPGVILATIWAVVVPVVVVERAGFSGTFRRSAELTRGSRWRVLGFWWLFAGALLIFVIPSMLLIGALSGALSAFGGAFSVLLVAMALLGGAAALLGATAQAVLYDALRRRNTAA